MFLPFFMAVRLSAPSSQHWQCTCPWQPTFIFILLASWGWIGHQWSLKPISFQMFVSAHWQLCQVPSSWNLDPSTWTADFIFWLHIAPFSLVNFFYLLIPLQYSYFAFNDSHSNLNFLVTVFWTFENNYQSFLSSFIFHSGNHYLHPTRASLGEGNGNLLQYSCLENSRDGGAWWAAVYGVAQSRTRLKQLSSSSSSSRASLVAERVKRLTTMRETWVPSLDQVDPLEKEIATHSSILAWEIPWTEEPGEL